jgi:hypothetical protein
MMRFRCIPADCDRNQVPTGTQFPAPLWLRREPKRDFPAKECSGAVKMKRRIAATLIPMPTATSPTA